MSKNAYVSGASRGIGRAIATRFASEGYNLCISARNKDMLEEVASELHSKYGVTVITAVGDVSDEDFVAKMSEEVSSRLGSLDVIINNAGISHVGLLSDMSYDKWQQVMNVNVGSIFLSSKYFLPNMIAKKSGKIISISSIWGRYGASMEVAYSASKGAVESYTKALAKELAPSGISVNAISCGAIDTDMNDHLSLEEKDAFAEEIPIGRFGSTEEVADMIYSIIEAPQYMTGQIIGLDGGY